jgi:uncharacterized membrane protein
METPPPWFEAALNAIVLGLETLAAVAIVVGVGLLAYGLFRRERPGHVRQRFANALMLALDFTIGADLLKVAIAPDLRSVAVVGGVVAIRIAMSLALLWEMRQERREVGPPPGEGDKAPPPGRPAKA